MKEHIHKYKKMNIGRKDIVRNASGYKCIQQREYYVFKCILPGCSSYKPVQFAIGDKCICWKCNQEMILDSGTIKRTKPAHEYCRKLRAA
jgi:hypothetical protein